MIDKAYLEITNVCNLDCSFCHKTTRAKKLMTLAEFEMLTDKLVGKIRYLYFHLMGEPMLHPLLPNFIDIAKNKGFIPMLTTNGSLLRERGERLLEHLPYKISISLHAPEANPAFRDDSYLHSCISFARKAAEKGCIIALRLWNLGTEADNTEITNRLHSEFSGEWKPIRGGTSLKLCDRLFLEYGEHFDWPDLKAKRFDADTDCFCYALRNHFGILVDGTVVPCCLDADGRLALGNLFEKDFDTILHSEQAKYIFDGFSHHRAVEPFCQSCGFIKNFRT